MENTVGISTRSRCEKGLTSLGRSNESERGSRRAKEVQVVAKLHAILRPFLLRRMKANVEQSLPGKKGFILYASMTEHQKNFQDHLINRTLENHLVKNISLGTVPCGMKGKLNNLMIQIRKKCNHPDLLESFFDGSCGQCGKFQLLDQVLIFSRWAKFFDIMDYYFSEKGFQVCRIDGNAKLEERNRQEELKKRQ